MQTDWLTVLTADRLGHNDVLEKIDALVDWQAFTPTLKKVRKPSNAGRPPYPELSLFKALLLQQWYCLSDPGLEEALLDRLSFRRFCGLSLGDKTPDETTLCRFRNALGGISQEVFEMLNQQLEAKGLIVRKGTMMDATLVNAQARRPSLKGGRGVSNPVDPDADWGRNRFGYKAHVAVDQESGLIRRAILTSARVNESEVADELVLGDEKAVYADRAYESKHRRAWLKQQGIKDRIMHRSHKNQKELPFWQQVRNRLISPRRSKVERLFGLLKRSYGYVRVRYMSWSKNNLQLQLLCSAVNLRRAVVLTS